MSFYSIMFGNNPASDIILATLGLTRQDTGRFRDCFVTDGKIAIYTRNGGGNRPDYFPDQLLQHPNYLYDEDDSYDSTYATIYFSFPNEYAKELEYIDFGEKFDPDERWQQLFADIKAN